MFGDYVLEKTAAQYMKKILLVDADNLEEKAHYSAAFKAHGFKIIKYTDDLNFRIYDEDALNDDEKIAVLVKPFVYVPYDIQKKCRIERISFDTLFPKLNSTVLRENDDLDVDLLTLAYRTDFGEYHERAQTERFLQLKMYALQNVEAYVKALYKHALNQANHIIDYTTWFEIAEEKAKIDIIATEHHVDIDTSELNHIFCAYVLKHFGKLSSQIHPESPVLVSGVMDYIHENSEKAVIIVMDGMSEFDWAVLKRSFCGIHYSQSAAFAMIPSTTSISRQCLLSGKYPVQLLEPWKQSEEKTEFYHCAGNYGYKDSQIGYGRGYETDFGPAVKCGAVIINDVDDMVHGQLQGRLGMLNDMNVLANQHKLAETVKRLLSEGFDVYISADHGNTPCTGMGKLMKTGVETQTKSRRMVVLKDFADEASLLTKYPDLIKYPGYYLDKQYKYLICGVGDSFDAKGEEVMSHGGITMDEVIVPFIKIKAVDNNG